MNQSKLDEGVAILSDLNIQFTVNKILKDIDVPISEEEIDYYVKNHKPSTAQIRLVNGYYTKYFGSYTDLNLLQRRTYIKLMLIMKKRLLLELGYNINKDGQIHHAALPYMLSGNVAEKVSNRTIRNNRFTTKIEESYMYQDLIHNKYQLLGYIKPDELMNTLSSMINTRFTYVTYEYPEMLGQEIIYSDDKISDELLVFLDKI